MRIYESFEAATVELSWTCEMDAWVATPFGDYFRGIRTQVTWGYVQDGILGVRHFDVLGIPVRLVTGQLGYWTRWTLDALPVTLETARLLRAPFGWKVDGMGGERDVVIMWGGFDGEYHPEVLAHMRDLEAQIDRFGMRGAEIGPQGATVLFGHNVRLHVYPSSRVLPMLRVKWEMGTVQESEGALRALRRGKELQELYTRMMTSSS